MLRLILCFILFFPFAYGAGSGGEDLNQLVLSHLGREQQSDSVTWESYCIADSVTAAQKKWLDARIGGFRKNHLKAYYSFKIATSKVEHDLAMLVVEVIDSSDPYTNKFFAIGLHKQQGDWKVAPLLGSFRFVGVRSFVPSENLRREQLESWARKEVDTRTQSAREARSKKVQQLLAEHYKDGSPLSGDSADDAAVYFIEMCRERNLMGVLACLQQGDAEGRHAVIEAMRQSQHLGQWKVLLGGDFVYAILAPLKAHSSLVNVGIVAPALSGNSQILELNLQKENGKWSVGLPKHLNLANGDELKFTRFQSYLLKSENRKRLKTVKSEVVAKIKSNGCATASELEERLLHCVKSQNMAEYFRVLGPMNVGESEKLTSAQRLDFFNKGVKLWRELCENDAGNIAVVDREEGELSSLVTLLNYQISRPSEYTLKTLCLFENEGRWFVYPSFDLRQAKSEGLVTADEIQKSDRFKERGLSLIVEKLLPEAHQFQLNAMRAITKEDSDSMSPLYASYRKALRVGDYQKVSSFIAIESNGEESLLTLLGHEASQYTAERSELLVVDVVSVAKLAGLVVCEKFKGGESDEYRLYPFVALDSGVKILPQCMFMYEHTRGQKLLNVQVLADMKPRFDAAFLEERAQLVEQFNNKVRARISKVDE